LTDLKRYQITTEEDVIDDNSVHTIIVSESNINLRTQMSGLQVVNEGDVESEAEVSKFKAT